MRQTDGFRFGGGLSGMVRDSERGGRSAVIGFFVVDDFFATI